MERLTITSLTFGAAGVARAAGKSWLIPNVAPGDVVEAEPLEDRRDYTIARLSRLLSPGPDRRAAPCEYLPRCGGCDWQHLEYAAQIRIKAELIAGEFRHTLGIELERTGLIEPAAAEFAYRSRIRLKISPDGGVGYREARSDRLVAIERCLVSIPSIEPVQLLARELRARCDEIEVVANHGGVVLIAAMRDAPTPRDCAIARKMTSSVAMRGIILDGGNQRVAIGNTAIAVEPEPGCAIIADADCFTQVNHAQNQQLVAAVMALAAITPNLTLLDLFCGAGNFALPAARRGASVTGVDSDARAIAAARENAVRMELRNSQFIAMNADETARFLKRANYRPQLVILDPPRRGAARLMDPISRLRPARIIYVSCDVRTLTRDLARLKDCGYKIGLVRAFDFFPNTHHVEVMAEALLT